MRAVITGSEYEFIIEGAIGEGSPLFGHDVRGASRIVINCEKMTYINSVGVKNWILWTVRVPKGCPFILVNAPLVMINQVSTVMGFMPPSGVVESFQAPFVCTDCGSETTVLLTRGRDFEYASGSHSRKVKFPTAVCGKCRSEMEPDFLESKVFSFLDKPISSAGSTMR